MIKKQTSPETNRSSDSFGVREKSLSFCRKTDPWMTPKNVCFPLLSNSKTLGKIACTLRLAWLVLTGPGGRDSRLVGVLPSLLSSEANRLRDSVSEALPQEVSTSADWTLLWFDDLEKIQPTNQTTAFPYHTFHLAFSWYIYQGNGIFFSFCFWKRLQLISSYKGIPSLTSRRFRSVNVSSPHSWTFVFTLDRKEASSQMSVQMSVSQVVVLVPFPWLWFFCFVLFLTSSQCCSPFL